MALTIHKLLNYKSLREYLNYLKDVLKDKKEVIKFAKNIYFKATFI